MDKPVRPTRRTFLDWLIGLGSAITGLATAFPALMYLWPAARGGGAKGVEVDGAKNLKPGQAQLLQVAGKAVVVVRDPQGFKAFSAICTHLGCLVKWNGEKKQFHCPCHAGVFDDNGGVVSGPVPGPLPQYKIKEISDRVYVLPPSNA